MLHGQGWQTLAAVKKGVDQPADVTLMAIGWLAREGKLDFTTSGRSLKIDSALDLGDARSGHCSTEAFVACERAPPTFSAFFGPIRHLGESLVCT